MTYDEFLGDVVLTALAFSLILLLVAGVIFIISAMRKDLRKLK